MFCSGPVTIPRRNVISGCGQISGRECCDSKSTATISCYLINESCPLVSPKLAVVENVLTFPGFSKTVAMGDEVPKLEAAQETGSHVANSDINFAAALRAQYAIETPKAPRRRRKKVPQDEVEEPLVDHTAILPLHSKKTERQQKRQHKRSQKGSLQTASPSLNDVPTEILVEILSWLRVEDIFRLSRTSHAMNDFVLGHENAIAKGIISRRYWILYRCFPVPVAFKSVPEELWEGLLSAKRQELLNIHRKSYHQHIEMIDPKAVCTCMTCVFAWNNLCLLVDLHHWQSALNAREPIPIIPRGTSPQWNQNLLKANADIVRLAMERPLYYAAILEKHLTTITETILRSARWKKKGTSAKPRLYHMTDWDVASGTDAFLDRKGPPSYDFPFHRDVYYSIEAYLPNRKFDDGKWRYYPLPPIQHEKDLEWVRSMLKSAVSPEDRRAQALANLKDHNIRWSQYLEQAQQV